jgi:hypothetical protein
MGGLYGLDRRHARQLRKTGVSAVDHMVSLSAFIFCFAMELLGEGEELCRELSVYY